ncbi:MAG TPA: NUDIX domain-containing protein [Candidatus Saccharimonadia bacterium]
MSELLDQLPSEDRAKQIGYRDARFTKNYDGIWQNVGKCVFCDLRDKYIFFEENDVVMTVSLFAYIDGHLMIIPRRHVKTTKELTDREWRTVRKFTYLAKKLIREIYDIKGMQIVEKEGETAQSTVNQHIHFHCIPFDAPDLSTWNYRKLKFTPVENANKYRAASKKLLAQAAKYDVKYAQPETFRMSCDAIILNQHDEILFQERTEGMKLEPDYFTPPGGGVHTGDTSLEAAVVRELQEEVGVAFAPGDLSLITSRFDTMAYQRHEPHLNTKVVTPVRFFWNLYLLRTTLPHSAFTPGDDCAAIHWVPRAEVAKHAHISPEMKAIIAGLSL